MRNDDTNMHCRVCGLLQGEPPWGEDGASPTYGYCPCCGVEFGYGDASLSAVRRWRENWIATGAKWDQPEFKPVNWNMQEQLLSVAPCPDGAQGTLPEFQSPGVDRVDEKV
jgi:hypothetical protein